MSRFIFTEIIMKGRSKQLIVRNRLVQIPKLDIFWDSGLAESDFYRQQKIISCKTSYPSTTGAA